MPARPRARKLLLALLILLGGLGLMALWLDARFTATAAQTEAAHARQEVLLLREAGQAACVTAEQITRAAISRGWAAQPIGGDRLRVAFSSRIRMKNPDVVLYAFDARGCLFPSPAIP
ncbi:hypothetical protein IQ24_01052 [Paracoccus sulfuroxidans]|uniref:Uncharacterized protein n=2 Tax=Paracoccus sulfuroxidans TaxID=384678 RepID=A0A562NU04_9RHOB|nr:hypothetical protein IQ24_01052 [Paracoccus sulfuroxidans]